VVWRRTVRARGAAAVVFALCAIGTMALGDGFLNYGGIWIATMMLALSFRAAVVVAYATLLCALAIALHLAVGSAWEVLVQETVAATVFTGLGAAFALVLNGVERANDELERRLGTEQDLVLARERERTARELHDGLGHRLTAIGLSLEYADRMRARAPEDAWNEVARARATVTESLDAMRRLVRAMHPVELGDLRGTAAFAAIADAFRSTGLDIRVHVDGDLELPREHSLLLLRFVQETLTNVVRHAVDARRVDVRVTAHDGLVEVVVEDIGPRAPAAQEEGFGLRSLRSRAEALDGSVTARPTPSGFLADIRLPLGAAA